MCLFCKIVSGEIPSSKVYEDDKILAFRDINPQAKIHVLVIPKEHIPSLDGVNDENCDTVAYIFSKITQIASDLGLNGGYRLISNCGPDACQTVPHLHFHILGGEQLADKMG